MNSKHKRYFSFFGILAATVNRKMISHLSSINSTMSVLPKIISILLETQLKPIKTYSTNNLK